MPFMNFLLLNGRFARPPGQLHNLIKLRLFRFDKRQMNEKGEFPTIQEAFRPTAARPWRDLRGGLLPLAISRQHRPLEGTGDMMKPTSTVFLFALASAALAGPLAAQSIGQATDVGMQRQPETPQTKLPLSKGAIKAITELQAAVKANDVATIPAKIAAAKAVAKTAEDRFAVAELQYHFAVATKDEAAKADALEALIASGKVPAADLPAFKLDLGNAYKATNQLDRAASTFEAVIASNPGNVDAIGNLAEVRASQGRAAEAVKLIQKGIAVRTAAGQKAPESWYKRAISLAYKAKLPDSVALARDWVAAYPAPASWHDAIAIYRNTAQPADAMLLDLLRLQRAAGALTTEDDFQRYASLAFEKGYGREAQKVLDEGFAAGTIDRNAPKFKTMASAISQKLAGDKAALAGAAAAGMAASSARAAMSNGDLLYGDGQFAKAGEVYRAALGKSGADANLINLHLGAALAQQGDKAGAIAALNAVTGANADIAKLWLTYLATRA
jgi:hypothetical protein